MDDLDLGATIKGFSPGQKVFNRYTLKKILGRGGMGVVWLAHDGELDRDIALKFLPEVVALDKQAIFELKRETRRSLDLTHSHIVRIHDFVQDGRTAAISMEYVPGDTLASLKMEQPDRCYSPEQLAKWVRQLCEALDYAHQKAEVVHRDLKPANLMIDARGDLKIADFGIAASVSDSVSRVSAQAGSSGTPVYMSPQQMMGEKPAVTDDIYALGATLYDLLTGKPPFHSGNILLQVQNKVPPPLAERRRELEVAGAAIPAGWEEAIAACLAKEAKDRPQSAGEVAERLGLAGGMATKSTRGAKNEIGAGSKVERLAVSAEASREGRNPKTLPGAPANALGSTRSTSKAPLFAGVAAVVVLLAGLGYYFGVYAPEQKRVAAEQTRLAEIGRLEAQARAEENAKERARLEAEALQLKTEQERAAAEAKARAEQERQTAERLAAARGGLVVRTTPAGAEVRVGAIALEKSPLTLKDQKLGKYPVRVRLDGYEEWTGEVEVKENDFSDLDVALVRSTGTLALASDPAGLEAEIAGAALVAGPSTRNVPAQRAKTPSTLKLPTGAYDITFRRPNWPEQKQTIEVARNESITATSEFAAGGLELASTPAGAEVWQNGRRVGFTPYQVADTIPGRYDFELKLKGYQSATAGLTVAPRQTTRENIALEKIPRPQTGQAWTIPDLNLTMQPIAPGTFQMGSTNGDKDEKPVTQVRITQPFWLGKTEVTQREWQAVMGNNPSEFKGDDLPVERVSWTDVMEFCRKLTERERTAGRLTEGYTYTLPTEAQWEYACRAGTTGDYAGSLDAMGWYSDNGGETTHPVGQKQANAWGLQDMHGNVWEWCADWYGNYPGGSVTDPKGASSGSYRVSRGGSWHATAGYCRSAYRFSLEPGLRSYYLGFRLALSSVP